MKGSDFIFDSVHFLYYKCHKMNFKRGWSYIDSPESMKKKKVTIHQKNKDYKCFQYATTVALNHEKVGPHPESVSKIKPFLNKYNWYGIKYLSKMDD